ncbi:putative cysteine peptidase, Clan CA, family C2 [Leishmania infantum JPCM5]|uniref:Putative cysteine peptidase, Clan CA, family C2 n=1 Tax=Leishmania infantum TaxID=5671 RepID=E9AHC1_LEIIN|nr:putative cysteine peptidase, Clan CA, family C2 [Leishmania infantum JPCM5]CBZ08798.1 putative cysteine peptidase, Clan CA, family C2 [Leishmania infantum JPCM5]|eukprot:XP_003392622.1 putative cysteine peptidase, Clan CA, family C2 [Leishmania infantum JPCM5]
MSSLFTEVPDSNTLFKDTEFIASNQDVADQWVSIRDLYPSGVNQPLLPEVFSREQFGQGNHYECFMLSALATLIRFPDVIRNCFVTKKVRQDGRYTFQFFRGQEWVKVEIDDTIPLEDDAVLYARSPTEHWWPLLLEKAYAKFYTGYDHLEGCTLQETFHDLTGNPVLNIPMDAKLAKAAGVNTKDGPYWLLMGECLLRGDHVLSALTKDAELESIGMQSEQQYAILGIFSLTGSSALDDIVIHLHNPFEDDEYEYSGPLNKNDSKWTAKLRQQYPVDDRYSIFIPLKLFLKSVNSIQHCFMRTIDAVSQTYSAAWKSESAGGNPTSVLWRKNPLFLVRNSGPAEVKIVTMIQQEDQRRFSDPDSDTTYAQCGVVVTRFTYQHPIPTFYVTGNSHKTIFKGLFLNSRDVSNVFTIPGHSMCYLVPCTMQKGVEASFQLSLYHLKDQDYSQLSVEQLTIPGMNWAGPATKDIELCQKKKDRADFYVDEGTDIHILTHQTKPYVSKSGGDAMTEDYMGMYLYDDTDRKIAGVHAATNFREISIIHRLPRSGRYAISITCPRAKGEVPAYITIVGSHASNVRIVDPPEDATMFDDEDIIDEGEDAALVHNPIDYVPVVFDVAHHDEQAESDSPFEDKRFYVDNRGATSEPWVHIGDLYPEGKTRPLLPNELSRDQFGQGDHYDCSTLTAFAALLEHHPDVIRNCFISKNPRKDGRYTFQFHRYGQWIKVEIDDRIPMVKGDTVFCRSPTHHWWPLLLEKAYAKFYTLYQNLENLSQEEVFHDYTGRPCISVSTDPAQAKVNMSYFDEAPYWKELASKLPDLCTTALASGREAEQYGLLKGRHYAVLDIVSIADGERVSDMLVKMYNPYEDSPYTGPMNAKDDAWTSELQSRFRPGDDSHAFYIPADNFVTAFSAMQMGYVGGLAEPSRHFNSEWGQDTNGGDTSLISWRKNPLFIFSNPTNDVVQLVAMLRQPDQRHLLHTMPNQELVYPMKGLSVAQANPSAAGIPTYLVTLDNHRLIHHEKPLAVREVTNVLTIPPQSVCYVAGHCNNRAVSKFLLSYWFMRGEDGEKLRIERYRPKVAQHQPAIAHVDLGNRASERVDFLIDTPTEVHAVLRQEKAFESPQGGDVIAQDYVGVYLYDLQNNCIKGLPSAMNYREVSLVTHLAKPGHYVFFITCPHSSGDVPCRVEIAADEDAHVRITETPQNAAALSALDMAFLDAHPESIPLSELPIDRDLPFQDDLAALERLLSDPSASAEEIQRLKDCLNERAHALAKAILASERPIYLISHDLHALNPLLDDDQAYMDAERERYYLKQDLRNHYKLPAQEAKLRSIADSIADELLHVDLSFIEARPEGIPRDAIPMISDKAFAEMTTDLLRLRRRPEPNPSAIRDAEHRLNERAKELARAMHDTERTYLDQQPQLVPLELLPLNTDESFCAEEDELRQLLQSSPSAQQTIAALQAKLNNHAHELARQLKDGERGKLLAASYEGIPTSELPLDTDAAFHEMEVERLRRVRTCADADADAEVARLEDEMRNRARDLAVSKKASERVMLRSMETPLTSGQLDALLDKDAETADMERRLRELRKKPDKNAAAIKALEEEVQKRAQELADGHLAEERSKCLAAEYGGRTMGALPLCDDAAYRDAEAAYMKMLESDHADAAALQRLIDTMNERAAGIAHDMNVADRAKYLPKALRGVPLRALPLDDDDEFRRLEHERARAAGTPGHKAEVEALEAQLLARADELARARLAGDRAYLAPEPAGIPLELVPLDEDAEFCAKEAQRAELKENGKADRSGIALRETELNARAVEVAQQLKDGERGKLLAASYEGIPTSELPLDTDAAFHEMEVEWLRLKVMDRQPNGATKSSLHAALNRRAADLARSLRVADLSSVEAAPLGLSKELLDLHNDSVCAVLIKEVRQLRQNAVGNTAVLREKESALNDRAFEVARRLLSGDRLSYLGPKPLSILLEHIPLDEDDVFHALEVERSMMKVTDPANSVAAVRKAENMLKDRACQLAELVMKEDLANFPPNYHGICTKDLKPHFDRLFSEAAEKRRAGMRDRTITFKENLEQIMDDRLNELALERKEGELYFIDPNPEGVPLPELPLSTDKAFNDLRQGRQELKESDPMENRKAIAGLEDEMNRRAAELARSVLSSDLDGLDKLPLGIPLDLLKPRQDAEVVRLIEELRRSKRLPQLKHNVAELQAKLNERVHELATAALEEGRDAYLDPHPEGVPREILPLRTDAVFQKEVQRAILRLQDPAKHAGAIAHLESELKACVKELALAQKEEDLRGLDQQPHDLPLTLLQPHQDAQLGKMIDELRWLKASEGDQHIAVKEVQSRMNDRCYAMADSAMKGDRCYLDPKPEKVPLRRLPLDTDAAFHALEVERAKLKLTDPRKNEHKIAGLEAQLNSRAAELARAVKKADLKSVEQTPRGIPLELLNLHEDPTFSALIAEKEQLPEGHSADLAARLLSSMNECAMKAADKLLRGDRGYLDQDPEGLPLGHLPLDTDTAFHEMEVERALLKARDPVKNSSTIKDLEAQLNKRAHDLANAALAMDRGYLSPRPEGVSIEELPLFTDSKFHSLEVERAKLKMSRADGHAERMQELEGRLNKRAASLAREQLEEDLKGLDQEPEGYPLNFLRPHNDAVFAAEVVSLRRAKKEPLVSAAKVRDAQEALNVRAHVLARERIAADRARLDQEPENVPLSLLTLEEDALFVAMEMKLRSLKASDKQSPRAIAEAEGRMNDRVHVMAAKVKAEGRDFLRSKSFDIPKELLALDADKAFVAMEKELWKQKQQPHAPRSSSAAADLRRKLQARADEVGEAQLKNDRDKYLDMQPEGVDLCDIPLDTDHAYHGMEVKRAILLAQDATGTRSAVEELDKELNARAHELAHEIVVGDRGYLPEEMHGIPVEELPLDTDRKFMKLERQRRAHKRSPDMKKEVAADEEELRNHALKLADEVIAMDLEPIKASYRGIAKEELNLHADVAFRELAKKRRRHRGKGRVEAAEVAAIEDEMDRRACEIADDLITAERAFLDPQPEGMYINEVPLDDDPTFQKLEQEYRRRRRDPRSAKQNGDVLRELTEAMNRRSHTLARAAFAKTRGFMEQEQEGIPLAELGLDEDPEFKEAEIARYRMNHSASPNAATVAEMELRMNERARELAWATLAADRVFLDPMPEGVLLGELPLDSDKEFGDLARERRRRKKTLKGGIGEAEVRAIEEKMNARSHELAKEFLEAERAFLSREPEGVPLAHLPLNADSLFRAMEDERLQLKREPLGNAAIIAAKETDLEDRAHVIAKDLLRKERAFLDQEPLGVPLEELPLNHDEILNPIERKRRALRRHPKRNHEAIRACEEQMADRVGQIAEDFVQKERAFLDQNPEGVPLRYLPLNTDREFHERELQRRKLRLRREKNRSELADTERKMNERVHVLAKDLVLKGRAFLHSEPCGVPIADVPLNEDEDFRKMEEQRRALKEAGRSAACVKTIEEKLNNRAEELAQGLLDDERAFMDCAPLGIPLHDLPLNTDRRMREIERTRRHLRKFDPEGGAVDIAVLETGMNARAYELADQLLSSDRDYLQPEPCGVPLADLPLHTDRIFHEKELARFRAKKKGQTDLFQMEDELNERAMELAAEFIQTERAYLDQEPEGIPLERLPLDTDPIFHNIELERRRLKRSGENSPQVLELERLLNRRAHELSMELRGWQDPEFHAANEHVAEQWVRVCDLYPEGRYEDFVPAALAPGDVVSAPQDMSYLVPFIAALAQHPVLLRRLIVTKEAPVNAPYTFIFFDPHGNPVYVDVDDRVPCDDNREPKFAQSPYNLWYPLLLEKAYAKFVGGYDQLINCTSLETLRDLTGRPVTHTPFKRKLAEAGNLDNYMTVDFWLGVKEGMARGDVVVCSSNAEVPNGIHPCCSYALVDVVITLEGSVNPSDIVIKLENSYRNGEPVYTGPLCHTDVNWSLALQRVCQYDPERDDVLYLPLPTFVRNFSSMQTCHINCGDRLTVAGMWNDRTSGGNANFTTFRNNPIFILQNNSSRPATVLAELRHAAPQFVDPEGRSHYPQSGIALMEPTSSTAPLTPLITNSTARFLHKSIMLDSREVCSVMEVPAHSTCLFIPYTANPGQHGAFYVSVYPGSAKVALTPLHYCGLSREPKSAAVTLTPGAEGQRVDFTISSPCDVHVLLRQEKMTDRMAAIKGDAIAEDDVVMVAFSDQAMKLTSSGDPTNAREHSLVFRAEKPGYYSLLLTSPNEPFSGDNPCTVSIFTPKRVMVRFVAPPAGARQLQHTRFPKLPQKLAAALGGNNPRQSRGASTACQSQQRQHDERLPPLRKNGASTLSSGSVSRGDRFTCSF